jgi:hypothetical protein
MLPRRLRRAAACAIALIALIALLALAASASAAAAPSWSTPTSVAASGLDGVSCPSFGLCVAVAGTNADVTTTPSTNAGWHQVGTGAPHTLLAVSCVPGTTDCAAVGDTGAIVTTTAPGSGWATASSSDTHNLTGVSCASTSFCVAVDSSGGAVYGSIGGGWTSLGTIDSGNDLTGVSCASSALCVAVDTTGNILVSATPSTAGAWTPVDSDGVGLTGVSCSAGATCVAVDSSGYAIASSPASSTSTWSATRVSSHGLTAVSCTTGAFCIAADSHGDIYESDAPASTSPAWSGATPDGTGLTAVSCVSDGLCAAVDGADALTATLPAPTVTTGAASAIAQTTATLSATVAPNDATITSCSFSYGTSSAYGASVPCSSAPSATGGAQTVTAQVSGLTASTTYDFEIVATSSDGTTSGANATFTTAAPLRPSVSVSGTPAVGDKLTCNVGVNVPAGLTVTYKWVRDTTPIAGATAATYVVALADESQHLYCNVMISGDGGTAGASSAYLSVPAETLGTVFETSVAKTSVSGGNVSTTVTCSPQALSQCEIALRLTVTSAHHTTSIGSKSVRIAIGAAVKVTVSLNASGRRLLASRQHMKATLTISGTIVGVVSGTIKKQSVTLAEGHQARRHAG